MYNLEYVIKHMHMCWGPIEYITCSKKCNKKKGQMICRNLCVASGKYQVADTLPVYKAV